jgi:hypothetical protein
MINNAFWEKLTTYCNENWKGRFSDRELKELSQLYLDEWDYSKNTHKLSDILVSLINQLKEDIINDSLEADTFVKEIYQECEKFNIEIE